MPDDRWERLYPLGRPRRLLSLGAGTQSSYLLALAAEGELGPVDGAIFSCTQWEPEKVYRWLKMLAGVDYETYQDVKGYTYHRAVPGTYRGGVYSARIPVTVVTAGSIRTAMYEAGSRGSRYAHIPLFVRNPDGSQGINWRQCTKEYKLEPILKEVRRQMNLKARETVRPLRGSHGQGWTWMGRPWTGGVQRRVTRTGNVLHYPVLVEQLIGISTDEVGRLKESRHGPIRNVFPLIDRNESRLDAIRGVEARGLGTPAKSACRGCPYTEDERWLEMKMNEPEEFQDAVRFDQESRKGGPRGTLVGENYVHRSLIPLGDVDFAARIAARRRGDPNMVELMDGFADECEGMCGV